MINITGVAPISFILARALGLVLFDATLDYRYNLSASWLWLAIILVIRAVVSKRSSKRF